MYLDELDREIAVGKKGFVKPTGRDGPHFGMPDGDCEFCINRQPAEGGKAKEHRQPREWPAKSGDHRRSFGRAESHLSR